MEIKGTVAQCDACGQYGILPESETFDSAVDQLTDTHGVPRLARITEGGSVCTNGMCLKE